MPSAITLLHRLFTNRTLSKICKETNHYAATINEDENLRRGPCWWKPTVLELEAWIGINMLMGIIILPNHRAYWKLFRPILYRHKIASCMSRKQFERITSCLHIVNDRKLVTDVNNLGHDKLDKIWRLLTKVRNPVASIIGSYVRWLSLMSSWCDIKASTEVKKLSVNTICLKP